MIILVGVVVSPLATVFEVERQWSLGVELCDFWISMDVMACTSSILHLVAIALDRYWSITDIIYTQKRTPMRIGVMLLCVWIVSIVVSVAPMLGWKDSLFNKRVNDDRLCLISQDLGYQVFSTAAAFYGPLLLIVLLYYQIFKAAKKRIRKSRQKRHSATLKLNTVSKQGISTSSTLLSTAVKPGAKLLIPPAAQETSTIVNDGCSDNSGTSPVSSIGTECGNGEIIQETTMGAETETMESRGARSPILKIRKKRKRESPEARRERKAFRTLAIITGSFVACWLPFFILAIARPICKCKFNPVMESVFLWLGYLNSALNPIIYTIFSPDFRNAFKKLAKKLCFVTF